MIVNKFKDYTSDELVEAVIDAKEKTSAWTYLKNRVFKRSEVLAWTEEVEEVYEAKVESENGT